MEEMQSHIFSTNIFCQRIKQNCPLLGCLIQHFNGNTTCSLKIMRKTIPKLNLLDWQHVLSKNLILSYEHFIVKQFPPHMYMLCVYAPHTKPYQVLHIHSAPTNLTKSQLLRLFPLARLPAHASLYNSYHAKIISCSNYHNSYQVQEKTFAL